MDLGRVQNVVQAQDVRGGNLSVLRPILTATPKCFFIFTFEFNIRQEQGNGANSELMNQTLSGVINKNENLRIYHRECNGNIEMVIMI